MSTQAVICIAVGTLVATGSWFIIDKVWTLKPPPAPPVCFVGSVQAWDTVHPILGTKSKADICVIRASAGFLEFNENGQRRIVSGNYRMVEGE